MSLASIQAAIPHRDPFLLIDTVIEQSENRIICQKTLSGDEFWFTGHYPEFPLMPGVLLCEAKSVGEICGAETETFAVQAPRNEAAMTTAQAKSLFIIPPDFAVLVRRVGRRIDEFDTLWPCHFGRQIGSR